MRNTKEVRLFIVLGMHRSGTSAITRGLSVLGVDLGDRLLPAVEGNNAKGFWEDIDLNALNIEMLSFLGSDWSHLAMITPAQIMHLQSQGYFLRAIELLRRKVGNSQYFGFKDPRVAKLLPFWREVFAHCGFDVSYVFAMRNPLSVARSLGKRDGIDSEQSYLLWLAHVVSGLINSGGRPCVVVDYDRLMQAPEAELARLAKGLNLTVDAAALQEYKADFLDEDLRHTTFAADDLLADHSCPPLVYDVYATLLDVACDKLDLHEAALQAQVESWFRQYEQLQPSLRLSDKLLSQKSVALANGLKQAQQLAELEKSRDDSVAVLNAELADRDARLARFEEHLRSLDKQIVELQGAVAERDAQVEQATQMGVQHGIRAEELNQLMTQCHAQLDQANAALAERDVLLADARTALAQCDASLNESRTALAERDASLNETRAAIAERDHYLNESQAALAERDARLNDSHTALAAREVQLNELISALAERELSLNDSRNALAEREAQLSRLEADSAERIAQLSEQLAQVMADSERNLENMQQVLADRERQIAALSHTVAALYSSTSWRLSAPVRWLGSMARVLTRS